MKRLVCLLLLLPIAVWAQRPLKTPLSFVAGEEIVVLDQSDRNLVLRSLSVVPTLHPQPTVLVPEDVRSYKRLLKQGVPSRCTPEEAGKLFLLTGDARFAAMLDSIKESCYAHLDNDSLAPIAAATLLNSLGWIAATDARGVYVNLFEDCMINIRTERFRFAIDQIRQRDHFKYRISGLSGAATRFVLRLRLPDGALRPTYYLNGRRLLSPVYRDGYLVLDREWRNGEEVYFDVGER